MNCLKLAILISNIHDYDRARKVYFTLLELFTDDEVDDYACALEFYYQKVAEIEERALEIASKVLSQDHPNPKIFKGYFVQMLHLV